MKKKRILVYGMTENPGGIESYILNLFNFLDKDKIILDFITDSPTIAYRDFFERFGAYTYIIKPKSKNLWSHIIAWKNILNEHPEYSVVYYNILDAGAVFSMLIPWLLRRKIVVHSHNGDTDRKYFHYLCRPLLCFMATNCIACSKLAAKFMFFPRQKKQITIIPNAINIQKFRYNPLRREYLRTKYGLEKNFVICHIGRITKQKNPYGLIDIFDALYQKNPNAILLYIGTGNLELEIKQYAHSKKSAVNIRFCGIQKDIPDILQLSDVFLLPSFYEGLPIVAIEAQASGLPCVLSDSITEEVGIMQNVIFKSLSQDPISNWVEALLDSQKFNRVTDQTPLIERGYDVKHCTDYYNKLLSYLIV